MRGGTTKQSPRVYARALKIEALKKKYKNKDCRSGGRGLTKYDFRSINNLSPNRKSKIVNRKFVFRLNLLHHICHNKQAKPN